MQRAASGQFVCAATDFQPLGLVGSLHDDVVAIIDADFGEVDLSGFLVGVIQALESLHDHLRMSVPGEGSIVGNNDGVIQVSRVVKDRPASTATADEVNRN